MGYSILVIMVFIGICMACRENEIIANIGCIIFLISIITTPILMVTGIIIRQEDANLTEDVAYEIYSINDNIESKGNFVLGAGHIESTDYYYFYIKTDKGFKVEKIEATNAYIQETDEVSPRIIYQYYKYIYPEWYKKWFAVDPNPHGNVTIIIKVPTNTVTTQYILDLQ